MSTLSKASLALALIMCLVLVGGLILAHAQHSPSRATNLDFESGLSASGAPNGWGGSGEGYQFALETKRAHGGKRCGRIRFVGGGAEGFGTFSQGIAAQTYRGQRVRFSGWLKSQGISRGWAGMWMRVDGASEGSNELTPLAFDNMQDRPVTGSIGWKQYAITLDVPKQATAIVFGFLLAGNGTLWGDDFKLTAVGEVGGDYAAPRPITERSLQNLTAFTRLLGYVRYFYPGDVAAKTDWNRFAIAGVSKVEDAKDSSELAHRLTALFTPIAPLVQVWSTASAKPDLPAELRPPSKANHLCVVTWKHTGYGFGDVKSIYTSERVRTPMPKTADHTPDEQPDPQKPFEQEIGDVSCRVPLALYADDGGTLPRQTAAPDREADASAAYSGNDRSVRLADIALAWNVFEHFYPYFEEVQTDWPAVLPSSLQSAATDKDTVAFVRTLRRMVAQLQDGHGGVYGVGEYYFTFPFVWRWIENRLVVTQVLPGDTTGLKPGDVVTQMDGKPAEDVIAAQETLTSSATPQWKRWRAVEEIALGPQSSETTLQVQHGTADPITIKAKRTLALAKRFKEHLLEEKRPADFAQIRPGIFYVDLGKVTQAELDKNLPQLTRAKGLICDLRGYPTGDAMDLLPHIAKKPFISANWNVPIFTRPDRQGVTYDTTHWPETAPALPHVGGKIVFLTDGRAISYAESYMGIVEAYKMAEIVGSTTAGTNGNINPFTLPGGYHVVWTGMKVTKHDGSRHHGVGIIPTVPVEPTVQGVAEGRDEVLEKGIEVIYRAKP